MQSSIHIIEVGRASPIEKRQGARPLAVSVDQAQAYTRYGSFELVELAVGAGLRQVRITDEVDLAYPAAANSLKVIKHLAACRVDVRWRARHVGQHELLHHLPAPTALDGQTTGRELVEWQRSHKFGSLYWRDGPGFVLVRDARRQPIHQFVLDEPAYREFARDDTAVPSPDADEVCALRSEGLVYDIGDVPVFLPYRMRHWPIPFNSI